MRRNQIYIPRNQLFNESFSRKGKVMRSKGTVVKCKRSSGICDIDFVFVSVFVWRRRLANKRQKKWEYDDVFTKIDETEDKINNYEDINYEEIESNTYSQSNELIHQYDRINSSPQYLLLKMNLKINCLFNLY